MRLLPRRKPRPVPAATVPGMPAISAHLSLNKYLGLESLDASDAIGVRHKGQVYKWTGKRGLDRDGQGRPCVKARARNADRDVIDVVQWLIPDTPGAKLVAPLDVHLIFPPRVDQVPMFNEGIGWEAFR
jgi:hypothetical protein